MSDVRRIALLGQPFWTIRLASLFDTHAADLVAAHAIRTLADWVALPRFDMAVRVGFRPGASTWRGRMFDVAYLSASLLSGDLRRAYYWIGTDVLNAQAEKSAGSHTRCFDHESKNATHWAGAPWLTEELAQLGLPVSTALFPGWLPDCQFTPAFPETFTVLTYIPDARPHAYGGQQVLEAALALPGTEFLVMGGSGTWLGGGQPSNLHFCGWVDDVTALYTRSSVVVRLVGHDALGGSVREGLALGRHVIYTYDVPHTRRIGHADAQALIASLQELQALHHAGTLQPNDIGREYARRAFDPRTLTRALAMQMCAGSSR